MLVFESANFDFFFVYPTRLIDFARLIILHCIFGEERGEGKM